MLNYVLTVSLLLFIGGWESDSSSWGSGSSGKSGKSGSGSGKSGKSGGSSSSGDWGNPCSSGSGDWGSSSSGKSGKSGSRRELGKSGKSGGSSSSGDCKFFFHVMCRVCKFKYQISPFFILTSLLQGTHVAQDHGDQVNRASLVVESQARVSDQLLLNGLCVFVHLSD